MNNKKRLFTTDRVDDSYFMSSDLHVNESIKDGLEFHIDGQRDNTYFTVYKEGIKELSEFLNKWLKEIPLLDSDIILKEPDFDKYIKSLQFKTEFEVEVKHICNGIRKKGESCTLNNKCTYPNCGQIKIKNIS